MSYYLTEQHSVYWTNWALPAVRGTPGQPGFRALWWGETRIVLAPGFRSHPILSWRLSSRNAINCLLLGFTEVTTCCHWEPIGMWVQRNSSWLQGQKWLCQCWAVLPHDIPLFACLSDISSPSTEIEKEVEIQVYRLKWLSLERVLIWVSMKICLFDLCPIKFP